MKRFIAEGLSAYLSQYHSVWHMPGHKRKPTNYLDDNKISKMSSDDGNENNSVGGSKCIDLNKLDMILDMLHTVDVTEVPGLDDLHNPNGMIEDSEKELARVYKTIASYYLVNGATCGIFAAVAACASNGEKIIAASNCHKSVHNIIELLKLEAVYIRPEEISFKEGCKYGEFRLMGAVTPESIETACKNNPDAKVVVVTSPTYEGIISDIDKISKIVHDAGMKLIVDEAHGAHLPFLKDYKNFSAIYNGADFVIQSLHKTMPSMTQTALLHVMNKELNYIVKRYLSVFMSSSPSYIMLCDMERAVDTAQNKEYDNYLTKLLETREEMKSLNNLVLLDNSRFIDKKNIKSDLTRLVFFANEPFTGIGLEKLLSDEFGVVCEMSGINYVVLISTFFDTDSDFDYLYNSLKKIDENYELYINKISDIENKSNQVYTVNANYAAKVYIEKQIGLLNDLEGTAAKDNVYVYPPGIYIVKKGEVYTKEKIDELISHVKQGRQLHGDIN